MENLSLSTLATLVGSVSGVLAWFGYFSRGEHHLWTARYLQVAAAFPFISFIVGSLVLSLLNSDHGASPALPRKDVLVFAFRSEIAFIGSVWTSMLVYRAFFHRLHRYPGPFGWKLSKIVQMYANRNNENYKIVHKLHEKYGDYVRTGPMELSIVDPDAAIPILTRANRGPWYEHSWPIKSTLEVRDPAIHAQRRKVWDQGFKASALRGYEPRVNQYVRLLTSRLAEFHGTPVNVSKWFNYFSFDVMGDLAFARDFNMLHDGKTHHLLEILSKGLKSIGYLGMVTWLMNFLVHIPQLAADNVRFVAYCSNLINERKKMKTSRPDIAHWLINGAAHSTANDDAWLHGDSRLVVVAGSDTTAATLAFAFYHLCAEPVHAERIRAELAALPEPEPEPEQDSSSSSADASQNSSSPRSFDGRALQNACPYLNAFITETLRLHPPVPGGFMRQTPPEGLAVLNAHDGSTTTVLPGETNVWMPLWTLMRSERCFTQPRAFAPARWLEAADQTADDQPRVLRKEAWLPFSTGPMGCVGKQLALQEIRAVIATLLDAFTPRFAEGEDGHKLLYDSLDYFTIGLGDLKVCFEERKRRQ